MKRVRAFTLIELLVVMAIIGVLAALSLPMLGRSLRRADQVQCVNNLRQLGISLQQFADDHHNRYPMQVAAAEGGAREATEAAVERIGFFVNAVENFVAIERELTTPKLLVCRAERRPPADSFERLRPDQVSYLLASNALPGSSTSVLAADRNLEMTPDSPPFRTNAALAFGPAMHERRGNVLLADGRVEWLGGLRLPAVVVGVFEPGDTMPDPPPPGDPGSNAPPSAPESPPGMTNELPAARPPAVTLRANRTPRMNSPPAIGSLPPAEVTTTAPALTAIETPGPSPVAPAVIAYLPLAPIEDSARSRWWWLLLVLVAAAWWYLRRREGVEEAPSVRGAPAGMTLQNAVVAAGTFAQTAGVRKFFTGAAINADLLVTMLDKHGIAARQEFARDALREHEDEFSREAVVFVPEGDYDRAYQLFYAERQDEL